MSIALQGPYAEPSSWGLKLMVRSSVVMLLGGSVAGEQTLLLLLTSATVHVHACRLSRCQCVHRLADFNRGQRKFTGATATAK
jgi:hypothetical protein